MKFKADKAPHAHLVGKAGEYRVISELLLRGIASYTPAVDVGIDLITSNGLRIQVKAAKLRTQKYGNKYSLGPAYFWSLNCSQKGAAKKYIKREILYSEQVDYLIMWGVDEDRFWIYPANIADNLGSLILYPKDSLSKSKTKASKTILGYENRWDLISDPQQSGESRPEAELDEFDIPFGAVPLFALHPQGVM